MSCDSFRYHLLSIFNIIIITSTILGYVGPWTPTPEIFNNAYFVLLKNLKWTVNPKASKFQYEDESKKLMMLPSDLVLIEDPQFKTYVDIYASDSKKFFADFADAFSRLLVLYYYHCHCHHHYHHYHHYHCHHHHHYYYHHHYHHYHQGSRYKQFI